MSIVELIQRRRSVRTYSQQPIEESKLTILEDYIENLNSPLFRFSMYQLKKANGKRQGAYGVIKGPISTLSEPSRRMNTLEPISPLNSVTF